MQPHQLTVYKVSKEWFGLTPKQIEDKLDAEYGAQKVDEKLNAWEENKGSAASACDWPQWFIDIVMKTSPSFMWDALNREWKVAYRSKDEADDAAVRFRAVLEYYVGLPEHAEDGKWFQAQKFTIRVRPLTDQALKMDAEMADSLEAKSLEGEPGE